MRPNIFEAEHDEFRATARQYFEKECAPNVETWEHDGQIAKQAWLKAGEQGLIGWEAPEQYGGLDIRDFRFNQLVNEEMFRAGVPFTGMSVQNDILPAYLVDLTTDDQKQRWLPGFRGPSSGAKICQLIM